MDEMKCGRRLGCNKNPSSTIYRLHNCNKRNVEVHAMATLPHAVCIHSASAPHLDTRSSGGLESTAPASALPYHRSYLRRRFTILIWLSHVYFLKNCVFPTLFIFEFCNDFFPTPAPSWCRASRSETAMRRTIPIGYVPCEGGYTKKRTGKGVIKVVLFIFCFWRYGTEDYYLTGTLTKGAMSVAWCRRLAE